jgi:hypothetical protein
MLKMNITNYMTKRYDDNLGIPEIQKQSQTKPIEPNLRCVYSWLNSKQSQNKPKFVTSDESRATRDGLLLRISRIKS